MIQRHQNLLRSILLCRVYTYACSHLMKSRRTPPDTGSIAVVQLHCCRLRHDTGNRLLKHCTVTLHCRWYYSYREGTPPSSSWSMHLERTARISHQCGKGCIDRIHFVGGRTVCQKDRSHMLHGERRAAKDMTIRIHTCTYARTYTQAYIPY